MNEATNRFLHAYVIMHQPLHIQNTSLFLFSALELQVDIVLDKLLNVRCKTTFHHPNVCRVLAIHLGYAMNTPYTYFEVQIRYEQARLAVHLQVVLHLNSHLHGLPEQGGAIMNSYKRGLGPSDLVVCPNPRPSNHRLSQPLWS